MRLSARVLQAVAASALLLAPLTALADEAPPEALPAAEAPAAADPEREPTPEERADMLATMKRELGAIEGPATGVELGDVATIDVPAGHWLVPTSGMARFNSIIENLADPTAIGAIATDDMDEVVYFSFDAVGYVKDDDRDLDADDLLESLREGTRQHNEQRRRLGYQELELTGWAQEPFYNEVTRSLEWAPRLRHLGDTEEWVNYNTRRLGREGVIEVVLATSNERLAGALTRMNADLAGLAFVPGKDYASFREGDRIAEYGLGGLVVGGAVAVAAKMGFLKKFWKLIVGFLAVVGGGIAKLFGRKKAAPVVADGPDDGAAA
ncbi:MAG: DUF2167 domain-containing protein [Myxococcales bacterium]|nr:DUF2167 domain-containing protein [Myxococcales bacterium]MCB9598497.1 DUF2167 domain-containing protein [Sandaracinaceae bacterium]MCB9733294.1 DUF2167 domain-containing protein [Deltaproteobacteria bacterium]